MVKWIACEYCSSRYRGNALRRVCPHCASAVPQRGSPGTRRRTWDPRDVLIGGAAFVLLINPILSITAALLAEGELNARSAGSFLSTFLVFGGAGIALCVFLLAPRIMGACVDRFSASRCRKCRHDGIDAGFCQRCGHLGDSGD